MALITKPDMEFIWASGGAIVEPSDVKKQTGWTPEVPPHQWENWIQNRQDNAIVHLFQKGISEWDAASNYYFTTGGTRSYVQGSNGTIYVAVADSLGQNPTTDTSNAYWKVAFADNNISAAIQEQKYTGFTTTGTATAQVLSPAPAIAGYSATQRFNVAFNVASGLNPTINVSGQGAKFLKQYNSSGAKVSAVFAANQRSDIIYDGADFILLDQLPVNAVQVRQGVRGSALNWKGLAGGVSASISYSCDRVTVEDGAGNVTTLPAFSLTLNTSVSASATVDGMASGATIASTWYNVFVWYNPTTGVIRLTGDISATAPTPPAAGFTQWARRSTFRTDATANKFPLRAVYAGNGMQYAPAAATNLTSAPVMIGGASGNPASPPTWAAVSVSPFIPPTASRIRIYVTGYNGGTIAAPNNSYGGLSTSAIQGAPIMVSPPAGNSASNSSMGDFILESTNIYYASGGTTSSITCIGYEDNV